MRKLDKGDLDLKKIKFYIIQWIEDEFLQNMRDILLKKAYINLSV